MPRRPPLENYGELRRVHMPDKQRYSRISRGSFSKVAFTMPDGSFVAQEWMYCREYFQDVSSGVRRILFSHKKNKGYNTAAFIRKVEAQLRVTPRSKFGPTQRMTITWGKISPWWTTTSMKRSLFTALIRCGENYLPMKDNFNDAIVSIDYTQNTSEAVCRFMMGYTKYTGKMRGWYNQFRWGSGSYYNPRKPGDSEIKKLLVKPGRN